MAVQAGERAEQTGYFHCAKCSEKVHVEQGNRIPECPNGHREFERRTGEPENS